MNHDFTHCADYMGDCPSDCFRAQLVRDLCNVDISNVSWSTFKNTSECKLKGSDSHDEY